MISVGIGGGISTVFHSKDALNFGFITLSEIIYEFKNSEMFSEASEMFNKLATHIPQMFCCLPDKKVLEVKLLPDEILRQKVIEFIQAIVVYKFPNLSLEEIQTMLDVSEFKNSC
ncbi:DUF2887 domain-containing protein [Planktothrix sp. FACHB-1365]|uniref:DUF2887 domain-containing protein n=1 Tax=Planktothrix sp. FACHB-1365 TaxID=2692855 RepID=UPI00168A1B56|nr:DUF2887 domain-containing protein [Planktothrix sp. FACHB-1365]MBD2481430.1 DUF2887 domain-containing protein [Planktothrix sp. FACHB-1365]